MTKKDLRITPDDSISLKGNRESKSSLSSIIASRERSIDFMSAFSLYLPDPDPILKKAGKDIKVYRDLLSDAHAGACALSRKAGVKSLEWELDRGKSKSKQAKLITDLFANLDLDRIIGEILDAAMFGYAPIEIIWEKAGKYILPSDLAGKPPEWFNFSTDNELQFRTKEKWTGEPVPPRKFLLPRYNPTYDNPYGERVLSRCFWPVTFKRGGIKFWVVFTEKYGMPYAIGKHPRGANEQERNDMLNMLERMVQDAIAVIPDDSSVDFLEAGTRSASADIYEKLLTFSNMEISKAILGQTLTTEMQSVGSYAAAQVHLEVREEIVDADKRLVENTLNTLIRWIYEINFSDSGFPMFSMYEEEDVDKTLAERDKILVDSGVKFTRQYWLRTYKFDEEDIEEG
jgi:phage gp29-like protein